MHVHACWLSSRMRPHPREQALRAGLVFWSEYQKGRRCFQFEIWRLRFEYRPHQFKMEENAIRCTVLPIGYQSKMRAADLSPWFLRGAKRSATEQQTENYGRLYSHVRMVTPPTQADSSSPRARSPRTRPACPAPHATGLNLAHISSNCPLAGSRAGGGWGILIERASEAAVFLGGKRP